MGGDADRRERWAMGHRDRMRALHGVDVVSAEELAVITDDESWVDLRVGQACTVVGKLESVGYGSPGTLIMTFADWSQLVLECENPRAAKPIPVGTQTPNVRVRAIRTEDGLKATVIIGPGGVPVPLNATP